MRSQKQGNLSCQAEATRTQAAIELTVLLGALEWVLWTDSKHVLDKTSRTLGTAMLITVVVILLLRQRPTLRQLGLAPTSWTAGLLPLFSFTFLLTGAFYLLGSSWNTIGNVENFPHWLRRNWHLEGVQQLLLQGMLVPRLAVLLGGPGLGVSVTSAVIFGLLHAPNLPLVVLTAAAAVVWCEWFRRFPNLPAVWVSHLILAAALLYCLNVPALHVLRVGIAYLY